MRRFNSYGEIMRLALQALFDPVDDGTEEGKRRAERIEREARVNERCGVFMRKLRDAVTDSSLKAPPIFAEESFPDANIVAEYLDCQSESDSVREEYERVCYESPEILAEVGCCYDILTNRLNREVEAPKNCRRRLYYVAWEEEPPSARGDDVEPISSRVEIPESRVDSKRSTEKKKLCNAKRKTSKESERAPRVKRSDDVSQSRDKRKRRAQVGGVIVAASVAFGAWLGYPYWSAFFAESDDASKVVSIEEIEDSLESSFVANDASAQYEKSSIDDADAYENDYENSDEALATNSFITEESAREPEFISRRLDEYSIDDGAAIGDVADYEVNDRGANDFSVGDFPTSEFANERLNEVVETDLSATDDSESKHAAGYANERTIQVRERLERTELPLRKGITIPERNNDVFRTGRVH